MENFSEKKLQKVLVFFRVNSYDCIINLTKGGKKELLANLQSEMRKHQVDTHMLAVEVGITDRAMRNKITGETEFKRNEMWIIRDKYFPKLGIEHLFYKESTLGETQIPFEEPPIK